MNQAEMAKGVQYVSVRDRSRSNHDHTLDETYSRLNGWFMSMM